jgi:dUTPase
MNSDETKKKLKGKVTTKLPKKVVKPLEPFEVALDIFPDTGEFIPAARADGGFDLYANATVDVHGVPRHTITSRVIQQIDCGFAVVIPKGYRLTIEPQPEYISKGLIIQSAVTGEGKQRVAVYAHNLGKEILVINKGEKIARMYLTSSYTAKVNIN